MATLPNFIVVGGSGSGLLPVGSSPSSLQPFDERPIGTYDGSNTVFTLSHTPSPQIVLLDVNGPRQSPRSSPDGSAAPQYTLSGNTITFAVAPKTTDYVNAFYFYKAAGPGGVRSGKARFFGTPTVLGTGSSSAGFASATGQFLATSAQLSFSAGTANVGDTVTIGSVTYTFVSALNNSVPNEILAVPLSGFLVLHVALALLQAINTGGDGSIVSTPTAPNPAVTATMQSGAPTFAGQAGNAVMTVNAIIGAGSNSIALSTTGSVMIWSASSISNGTMNPGDTITGAGVTYTFVSSLNNSVPYQVLAAPPTTGIAAPSLALMLANAINKSFGAGTLYSSATVANPSVTASAFHTLHGGTNQITVTAQTGGVAGNSIAISASAGGRFSWNGSTLSGGTGGGSGASADEVNWGNSTSYIVTGDLSIGVWVKIPPNGTNDGVIIQYGQDASGPATNTNYFMSSFGSPGAWSIRYLHDYGSGGGGSYETYTFAANLANDIWYFLFLVRNTTAKTVKLYKAQVGDSALTLVGTFSYTNQPSGGGDPGNMLCLGVYPGSSGNDFVGTIEEHYVWSRALATTEGLAAMQANPPFNSMILGSYMGDTPEIDISGNGGSGTVTGTTLVQGHS